MGLKQRFIRAGIRQFHHPTGIGGHVAGWVMGRRSSNVKRNRWAVDLLDVQPTDHILELGCGPGIAIAALAARASSGLVVGVDHSDVMIGQARRRNAATVRAGRVRFVCASVDRLAVDGGPFDAALAVNTAGMWPDPPARLREIGALMRPGGQIALVSQPRCPGATAATSATAGDELARMLTEAGFTDVRVDTLGLDPPAVCVRAYLRNSSPRAVSEGTAARPDWR